MKRYYRNMVLRILLGMLIGLALMLSITRITHAATLQPVTSTCRANQFVQQDIAGTYENAMMYVEMAPCGEAIILWMNTYGEHGSGYLSERRISTGGVLLSGYMPDPQINSYLDSVPYVAFTPAEPGWVYLTTLTDQGQIVRRYRLRKTS